MRLLRIDSVGGASGDMLLAALADLGIDLGPMVSRVRRMLPEDFRVEVREITQGGIHGRQVSVTVDGAAQVPTEPATMAGTQPSPAGNKKSAHHHHPSHEHQPGDGQGKSAHHHHAARGLTAITSLLKKSDLPEQARDLALETFRLLAAAEAKVHDTTPEDVHFHEVGAVDAIVDIVVSCLAIAHLRVTAVQVGPLPVGSGVLHCDHGLMPIPAPATVELLAGHPLLQTDETAELVTPTGAALLMCWKKMAPAPAVESRIMRAGYGFASRQLRRRPNMLRATLMESYPEREMSLPATDVHTAPERLQVIETNLDDCSPEWIGSLHDTLPGQGALDIWTTAAGMKKNRPGIILSVLCRPEKAPGLIHAIFRNTPALGLRVRDVCRLALARDSREVDTPYGAVRIKTGSLNGEIITRSPEFSDCENCAAKHNITPRQVYESALKASL